MNIQPHFFGLGFNDTVPDEVPLDNLTATTMVKRNPKMISAKMIALQLRAERKEGWTTQMVKDFELSITDYFEKEYKSDTIRLLTLSTSFVVRAGMSLLPFLVVGFAIMACVSTLTTFLSAAFMGQTSIHKFSLAIMACICPFMACGTALGALFYMGVRFGSILCVTPFLVLAIVKGDCAAYRLAQVLSDTGPAIMISALTNMSADAVGAFTSSPEITLLCYGNAACIFVDFIYQITLYSAVMVLAGNFELENERKQSLTQRVECGTDEVNVSLDKSSMASFRELVNDRFSSFMESYVSLVTAKVFDIIMIVVWLSFLVFSVKGITQIPINLTPKKLFSRDSSLVEMDTYRVNYVIPYFTVATVFVNKPGNLSDQSRVKRLNQLVDDMESLPGAWGPESTNFFLRDFVEYEKGMSEIETGEEETSVPRDPNTLNTKDLASFLEWPEYKYWRENWNGSSSPRLIADRNFREWFRRDTILKQWRSVADKYRSEFNTTVFYDDAIYLDLIENMPTDTWQSGVATICCMAIVCMIFMWDPYTVVITTAVIASIMTGILGTLSWTGTELDPIVMAALVISIGFSVDIPAHVSFHYYAAGK
ncbi:patched family protein [Cooperia oncophora]